MSRLHGKKFSAFTGRPKQARLCPEKHRAEGDERPCWVRLWRLRLGTAAGKIVGKTAICQVCRRDHFVYVTVPVAVEIQSIVGKVRNGEWEGFLLFEANSIGHSKAAFVFDAIDEHA